MRANRESAALGIGVALGFALVVIGPGLTSWPQPAAPAAPGCVPGSIVAWVNDTYPPILIANSPYNGTASGSVPITNGTHILTLSPRNGSAFGVFERMNWTVRIGKATGGTDPSCVGTYYLVPTDDGTSTTFPLSNRSVFNFTTDSQEPNQSGITGAGGPVYFYDGFYTSTSQLSTCGAGTTVLHAASNSIRVGVTFEADSTAHVVNVTIPVSTNYTYTFPANAGTWSIDNLSAPGGPGGGWAFGYVGPCV
jgi:hypothetical protein